MANDMVSLIEPQIPALRRYARALLRDASAADDLVQDCLERAITSWHQRRADGNARSWLFTILHNLAMNRLRQEKRRGRHVGLDDAGEGALSGPARQEDRMRYRDIVQAIAALPEDQRSVLLLVCVEEMAYAETAAVLQIPMGTVMSRLARGRDRLRAIMEGGAGAQQPVLRRVK